VEGTWQMPQVGPDTATCAHSNFAPPPPLPPRAQLGKVNGSVLLAQGAAHAAFHSL